MFGAWTLSALGNLLLSSFSIATLIGAGAVAVAVLTPPGLARFIPNLRLTAICVALAAFSYSSVAGKFYHDGLSVKQAEWDAALGREAESGEQILDDALRDAASDTPDSVRANPWNRDNWKR